MRFASSAARPAPAACADAWQMGIFRQVSQSRESLPIVLADNLGADCIGHGEFADGRRTPAAARRARVSARTEVRSDAARRTSEDIPGGGRFAAWASAPRLASPVARWTSAARRCPARTTSRTTFSTSRRDLSSSCRARRRPKRRSPRTEAAEAALVGHDNKSAAAGPRDVGRPSQFKFRRTSSIVRVRRGRSSAGT